MATNNDKYEEVKPTAPSEQTEWRDPSLVGKYMVDPETGLAGLFRSPNNGESWILTDTVFGHVYDSNEVDNILNNGVADHVKKEVDSATAEIPNIESTANEAVKKADSAIAASKVNADAHVAMNSAISAAQEGVNSANAAIQQVASNASSNAAQIRADVAQIQKEIDTSQSANSASVEKLKSDISSTQNNLDVVRDNLSKAQSAVEQNQKLINDSVADINSKITQDRVDIAAAQQANADTAKKLDGYTEQAAEQGKTIKIIQDKQDGFFATIADVKGNVTTVSNTVDGLSAGLKDAQGNIASVKAQADQLNATLTDHSKNITQLTATAKELSSTLEDASGRLSKVEQTATEQSTALSDLQGNLSQVKQTADGLVTTLKDVQGNVSQLQQTAKGTTEQISNIQGDITNLQTDVTGVKATIAGHDKSIHTLQADSKTLKDNMADAQGNISSLQKTSTDLTSTMQDHSKRLSKVEQTASTLTTEFSAHDGRLSKVEQTANGIQQTVADQQGQINTIKTDANGIHATLTGQGNQIATINTTLDGLNTKYESVEQSGNELKNRLDSLKVGTSNLLHHSDTFDGWTKGASVSVTVNKYLGGSVAIFNSPGSGTNALNTDLDGPYDNQPVTWTVYAKADNAGDKLHTELYGGGGFNNQSLTTEWQVYKFTGQRDTRNHGFFLWGCTGNKGNIYVALPFAVVGNTIGTWSPNPTDIADKITANTTQIYQNKNSIALKADQSTVDNLSGKVSQNTSQLNVQADQISSKVSSADFNALDDKVDGAIAQIGKNTTAIDQNKSQISLKADQTEVDKVKNTASNNSSRLDVMAGEVKSKVTSTDVNNIINGKGYATTSSVQSMITQSAGSINETITNLTNEVNTRDGVNLLTGTKDFSGAWQIYDKSDHWHKDSWIDPIGNHSLKSDKVNWNGYYQPKWLDVGTYTFSLYYCLEGNCPANEALNIYIPPNGGDNLVSASPASSQSLDITANKWHYAHFTFQVTKAGYSALRIESSQPVVLHIASYKLERGSIATPWTPAPSDNATVTQIQSVTASIDGLQSNVTNYQNDTSSKFTQLSSLIQLKVSQGDFDSKVTQLANDINLRVTKGDLLSQINVEAGNTLIQSNKIYLDASSVVFSGNAFIPSAAIASLSADKINTGLLNTDNIQLGDNGTRLWARNGYIYETAPDQGDSYNLRMNGNSLEFVTNKVPNNVPYMNGITPMYQLAYDGSADGALRFRTFQNLDTANNRAYLADSINIFRNKIQMAANNQMRMEINQDGIIAKPTLFFQNNTNSGTYAGFTRLDNSDTVEFNTGNNDGENFHVNSGAHFKQYVYIDGYARAQGWLTNSTLSKKTNVKKLDKQAALDKIRQDDQYLYEYKRNIERGIYDPQASFIIDDVNDVSHYSVPREFIDQSGNYREPNVELAYLVAAFQAIDEQVQSQQAEIRDLKEKLQHEQ